MKLNNLRIVALIRSYRESYEDTHLSVQPIVEQFRREVEQYIYAYPRIIHNKDPDFCSDFYLFVLPAMESFMRNYPMKDMVPFHLWFNVVLNNQIRLFFRKNKIHYVQNALTGSLEEQDFTEHPMETRLNPLVEEVQTHIERIDLLSQAVLTWHYTPMNISSAQLQVLVRFCHLDMDTVLDHYHARLVEYTKEVDMMEKMSAQIGETNFKLQQVQYKLEHSAALSVDEKRHLMQRVAVLKAKRDKLLYGARRHKNVPMTGLSEIFGSKEKARYVIKNAEKRLQASIFRHREQGDAHESE